MSNRERETRRAAGPVMNSEIRVRRQLDAAGSTRHARNVYIIIITYARALPNNLLFLFLRSIIPGRTQWQRWAIVSCGTLVKRWDPKVGGPEGFTQESMVPQ